MTGSSEVASPSPSLDDPPGPTGRIPYRLWIGVTGHRDLPADARLRERISEVVERIRELRPGSPATPVKLAVSSPLAEGADRLVAEAVLDCPEAVLEAPLPLDRADYVQDFKTAASRTHFNSLLRRASMVLPLPQQRSRPVAYSRAGDYVINRSDVLIAIWDGHGARGTGGTGHVVRRATERGLPFFWIRSSHDYRVDEAQRLGISTSLFADLDAYNRAWLPEKALKERIASRHRSLANGAIDAGMPPEQIEPFLSWIVPYIARADELARRYQRTYLGVGMAFLLLAALAVIAAGSEVIRESLHVHLSWMEPLLMALALVALASTWRLRAHRRWISYRSLAERLRLAFFLVVAGLGGRQAPSPDRLNNLELPFDWTSRAFEEVWITRPSEQPPTGSVDGLKLFLAIQWIDDQLSYYRHAARRNATWYRVLNGLIITLVSLTLVAASVHALGWLGPPGAPWLTFLTVAMPALAGAAGGVLAQREFETNAARFRRMTGQLQIIRDHLMEAQDLDEVQNVAESAAALMLDEHRDWFGVMQPHDLTLREFV